MCLSKGSWDGGIILIIHAGPINNHKSPYNTQEEGELSMEEEKAMWPQRVKGCGHELRDVAATKIW